MRKLADGSGYDENGEISNIELCLWTRDANGMGGLTVLGDERKSRSAVEADLGAKMGNEIEPVSAVEDGYM